MHEAQAEEAAAELVAAVLKVMKAIAAGPDGLATEAGHNGATRQPELLPFAAAGDYLGMSRRWVFQAAKDGVLPAVEVPGLSGRWIRRVDLDEFVSNLAPDTQQRPGRPRPLRSSSPIRPTKTERLNGKLPVA